MIHTFKDLNLNSSLTKAINDLGFTKPTTIQQKVFSVAMSGKDVVGLAQTGTGKTIAYLLPLLRLYKFSKLKDPTILIVVPTRELVAQVVSEIEKLTGYMSIRVAGVYGGTNINTQKKIVNDGLDILVATPGRLVDLALDGSLKLKNIQKFVVDEVDEMFDLGFRTQLNNVFDMLPKKRQNLMFSATITPDVDVFIKKNFSYAQWVEAAPNGTPLEQIVLQGYKVPNFYTKLNLLIHLLQNNPEMSKVLVFAPGKRHADLMFEPISNAFPENVGLIHSNKEQNYRFNSLKNFQNGTHRILIATDLVARGLDISDVTHVINIDTPDDPLNFIHRVGRTGRADKSGFAITFITPKEKAYQTKIEGLMKKKIPMVKFPTDVEVSKELLDEEKTKTYADLPEVEVFIKTPKGAFHEKLEKNKKVNLGGSYKREIKLKYKKPKTRGAKKK